MGFSYGSLNRPRYRATVLLKDLGYSPYTFWTDSRWSCESMKEKRSESQIKASLCGTKEARRGTTERPRQAYAR